MTLEQLSRLRAMVEPDQQTWDLNPADQAAIRAALDSQPNPSLVKACQAVLMFYSSGPWSADRRLEWFNLTGLEEATTRGLCDVVRSALSMTRD